MKTLDMLAKTFSPTEPVQPKAEEIKFNDDLVNKIAEAVISKLSTAQAPEEKIEEPEEIIEEGGEAENDDEQSGEVG